MDESTLNDLNERLGSAIIEDGRFFAGTTLYDGKVALRPAIVSWRTRETDVDAFMHAVSELAPGCAT